MSNVLSEEKKQQVIALGKLGWSLRRVPAWVGTPSTGKTGHRGDPRLYCAFFTKTNCPECLQSCEAYRDLIEKALDRGRTARLSGKTWSRSTALPVAIRR